MATRKIIVKRNVRVHGSTATVRTSVTSGGTTRTTTRTIRAK